MCLLEDLTPERNNKICKKEKLSTRYVGPYEILKRVVKVAYELKLPNDLAPVHSVFHVSMLKKCIGDPCLFSI